MTNRSVTFKLELCYGVYDGLIHVIGAVTGIENTSFYITKNDAAELKELCERVIMSRKILDGARRLWQENEGKND